MRRPIFLLLVAPVLVAAPVAGQEPVQEMDTAGAQVASEGISPGGAFLRSLLIPGWGHAAVGSYTRGGFYFLVESSAAWMLVKTASRLRSAEEIRDLRRNEAGARIPGADELDPDTLRARVDADPAVADAEGLVEARSQQLEDWLAVGIFFLFLGGADAFVSAHLRDFPAPVEIEGDPSGRVELRISLPVGGLP